MFPTETDYCYSGWSMDRLDGSKLTNQGMKQTKQVSSKLRKTQRYQQRKARKNNRVKR